MATKTRLGVGTLAVVCLVTAAGIAAMRGVSGIGPRRALPAATDSSEMVTFFVSWDPSPRSSDVRVAVMDAGLSHPWKVSVHRNSPFVYEAMIRPVTVVKVHAQQPKGSGLLTCKIRKGLRVLSQNSNEKTGDGSVICEAVT